MTTISKSADPRREQRLAEELARIARRYIASDGGPALSALAPVGKRFLDLLELAQRGLVENTITDTGHRYHNPRPGNLEQLPPGDYIVVYLRVESRPTTAGLTAWRTAPTV